MRSAVAAADGVVPRDGEDAHGIDERHLTYLDAGRIAEDAGVAWVALHGRTAAQQYSGRADWDAIATLKAALAVPVLGNGDVWAAADALRMVEHTGSDGVVVGRGCLGRPWLFGDLAAAFAGHPEVVARPALRGVVGVMRRHAELLGEAMGDEGRGCRDFRKHVAWYLKGFRVGPTTRAALGMVASLDELDLLLGTLDPDQPYPAEVPRAARPHVGGAGWRCRTAGSTPASSAWTWTSPPPRSASAAADPPAPRGRRVAEFLDVEEDIEQGAAPQRRLERLDELEDGRRPGQRQLPVGHGHPVAGDQVVVAAVGQTAPPRGRDDPPR